MSLDTMVFFKNGTQDTSGSKIFGYKNKNNYVVRFEFTTGNNGATKVEFDIPSGAISTTSLFFGSFPFYLTTSSSNYRNANRREPEYPATGYMLKDNITGKYSGSVSINLLSNKKYYVFFYPQWKEDVYATWDNSSQHKATVTITERITSTLYIDNDNHSSIIVKRGSDVLNNGAVLSSGDTLSVSVKVDEDYYLKKFTMNNASIQPESTIVVQPGKDVGLKSVSSPAASKCARPDWAYIGDKILLKINKMNPEYKHTVRYKYGPESGAPEGIIGDEKISDTNIEWTIPESFYDSTPGKTKSCYIYVETFNALGDVVGEETSVIFPIRTKEAECRPNINIEYESDEDTQALVGTDTLIKYFSKFDLTITSTAKKSATLDSVNLDGEELSLPDGVHEWITTKSFDLVDRSEYRVTVVDSREYSRSNTLKPRIIEYVPLTCNMTAKREDPNEPMGMKVEAFGNFYTGEFNGKQNNLRARYQYRYYDNESKNWSDYSDMIDIPNNSIYIATNANGYKIDYTIEIEGGFKNDVEYEIVVNAYDYVDTSEGIVSLTNILTSYKVPRSLPVFDYGKDDFNFNVDVKIKNQPVGDFVVEYGRTDDGVWEYRKWASGVSECYGEYTEMNVESHGTVGTLYAYRTDPENPVKFPDGLFVSGSIPNVTYSGVLSKKNGVCLTGTLIQGNLTNESCVYYALSNHNNTEDFTVYVKAYGRWKN